jgi:hypothetical protein
MRSDQAALTVFVLAGALACGTTNQSPGDEPDGASGGTQQTALDGSGSQMGTHPTDGGGSSSSSSSGGADGSGSASTTPEGGYGSSGDGGSCTSALSGRMRITEIDVGVAVSYDEVDTPLTPLAIAPIPGGGSRVGFMSNDGKAHVVTLDAQDQVVAGSGFGLTASDFQDIYADSKGGVMLVSRPSAATGTLNCGTPSNLCGAPPNPAIPCFDMYMVRFDGSAETWSAKLTQSDATHPPYLTSKTDPNNIIFIWWYAHNGRIAFDGTNWGAYFGAAISVTQGGCVNIHQGDRLQIVNAQGAVQSGGFNWGCSHSGYERILWDPSASKFVTVCKNDAMTGTKSGRIAFASAFPTTIYPVDLNYSDLGSVLTASGGGYWIVTSDIRSGQTPSTDGLADIHLLHVASAASPTPDKDIVLASDSGLNDRGPHLAAYGNGLMVAAWDTSTAVGDLKTNSPNRTFEVRVLDRATGAAPSGSTATSAGPVAASVLGSRYQDFRSYSDGSVAYVAPGSSSTKIKVLRVLACN